VGLGNIAGVAIAVGTGGPGATFWMIVAGLLGMTSKFTECSLGQMYRKTLPDGTVSGGPMHYLREGLAAKGLGPLGAVLAAAFTILCIGGSLGGGCMFQVGQSMQAVQRQVPLLVEQPYWYGVVMVVLAGVVIIGGIKRIARVADKIVPLMAAVYILMTLYILAAHWNHIPRAFGEILSGAFTPEAAYGGALGVLVVGIRRASFSNEAGVGSAAIAHSAAKTDEPISEGIVALLEPFIDTVVICTMTGLIIVITGVYAEPALQPLIAANKGAELTASAVGSVVSWFPAVLSLVVFLFAYSTLISWSYYGERCATHLFGPRGSLPYKVLFLCFVFLGSILAPTNVLDFSDLMILSMAFPNVLGLFILSGDVRRKLDEYWALYRSGALKRRHK
jgi:AGCS family alanine or glycine:cation symporter